MSDTINVKQLTKEFSEKLKEMNTESYVAKIIEQFEEKANKLNKEVGDLEIRRINLAKDVQTLQDNYKELKNKNENISDTVAKAVDSAVKVEKEKALQLNADLLTEKNRSTDEHRKLASARVTYEDKVKECNGIKAKLEDATKEQQAQLKDAQVLKDRLTSIMKMIKEAVE